MSRVTGKCKCNSPLLALLWRCSLHGVVSILRAVGRAVLIGRHPQPRRLSHFQSICNGCIRCQNQALPCINASTTERQPCWIIS